MFIRPVPAVIGLLTLILLAPAVRGLEFETASVKLHPVTPGTYLIKNYPHAPPFVIPTSSRFTDTVHVEDLIMEAYGINEYQILYLPSWASARQGLVYDIETKSPGDGLPTPAEFQEMLQALLADRFHLKTHWETKKISVYALVPDKKGPKFHEFHKDDTSQSAFAGTTIFALAHFLSPNLDAPVVDGTGFGDKLFDFDINKLVNFHEIDREQGADPLDAQDYLRSAVLNELGLRLDSRKVSMQILAIDHIDEPSTK